MLTWVSAQWCGWVGSTIALALGRCDNVGSWGLQKQGFSLVKTVEISSSLRAISS